MFDPKNHIIHLVDGRLSPKSKTSRIDVCTIVTQALASASPSGIVIHFHGGLVSENNARAVAEKKLFPLYSERAQAYPIFFVWESGLFEAPLNNMREIAKEGLFREFVKKAAEWVLKKLPSDSGFKGAGGINFNEAKLREDFDAWFSGQRETPPELLNMLPHATTADIAVKVKGGAALDEEKLENDIADSIEGDDDFKDAVQAVYNGLHGEGATRPSTKGTGLTVSEKSLIGPKTAFELFGETVTGTTKGFGPISWIKLAKAVVVIVVRVIRRFSKSRAHGMYVTLVEETLRELYVDKIGKQVWWDRMKDDTADAFKEGEEHGGTAFLSELKTQLSGNAVPPKITLVGHSTGAIYICNLLKAAATCVPDLKFDVIFEAPAATHILFSETIKHHGHQIRNFRQFGMQDSREASDTLVPILYRSSLLYFVSGLLKSEPDEPLVGMERFLKETAVFDATSFPYIEDCRKFYESRTNSRVWSPSNAGPGCNSDGKSHGDFDDNDALTMESVQHILQSGV